jgi:hypothetical protein
MKLTTEQIDSARELYRAVLKAEQALIEAEEAFADNIPDGVQPHEVARLLNMRGAK